VNNNDNGSKQQTVHEGQLNVTHFKSLSRLKGRKKRFLSKKRKMEMSMGTEQTE
jgi:hypothetical protein